MSHIPFDREKSQGDSGSTREELIHLRISSVGMVFSSITTVASLLIAAWIDSIANSLHEHQNAMETARSEFEQGVTLREITDEASRVAVWVEADGMHVMNRTADPIPHWGIVFSAPSKALNSIVYLTTITPCAEIIIGLDQVAAIMQSELDNTVGHEIKGIYFEDRRSDGWYRSLYDGLLQENITTDRYEPGSAYPLEEIISQPLSHCGS
ncbi:hypothetical protein [Glycomyces tarimensis]